MAFKFDRDRAIRILVDAEAFGDVTACDKWKISLRTLQRYRDRLKDDATLSQAVAQKKEQVDIDWQSARRDFLRSAIGKLKELIAQAGPKQMRDVAGAIKIVGDLEIVSGALNNGEQPEPDRESPKLEETSSDPGKTSPPIN